MAVEVMREDKLNKLVARQKGVRAAVRVKGEEIYALASGRLAAHRQEYEAKLEIRSGRTDTVINFIDPAVLSIEFGHFAGGGEGARTWVEGIHIFRGYRYVDGVV